jgi:hypothetical protein
MLGSSFSTASAPLEFSLVTSLHDFADVLAALLDARVRFLIVGGCAVQVYLPERETRDLDIWCEATPDNARRLHTAVNAVLRPGEVPPGGPFDESDFHRDYGSCSRWRWRTDVDLIPGINRRSFDEVFARRKEVQIAAGTVPVVGLVDLLVMKMRRDEPRDRADIRALIPQGDEKRGP